MRITLCGSAKFEKAFKEMNQILSLQGHVVYSIACYPSDNGGKNWYTAEQKTILDQVHFRKIDNSDAIVVINVDGYVGESTAREILYAASLNRQIFRIYSHELPPLIGLGITSKCICPFPGCMDSLANTPPCAICYE